MTKWIILGGALLLGLCLSILFAVYPTVFQGVSGLMIWFFLGFCSIIVVAQIFPAARALLDLARRQAGAARAQAKQPLKGGKQ